MNKKLHLYRKMRVCFFLIGLLFSNFPAFSQTLQQLIDEANNKDSTAYTIPSFTEMKRQLVYAKKIPTPTDAYAKLDTALKNLKDKRVPYNIVMNINGDPRTQMGFNWYNNTNITGGVVQIVKGTVTNQNTFNNTQPKITINATTTQRTNLNYNVGNNKLDVEAGIANNSKRSYTENKAVATGLLPGTTYSFRVGGVNDHWSDIGTFTTAKDNKDAFSFIYTADSQAETYAKFDVARTTTHAAFNKYPNVSFWLQCGDLIQSAYWFSNPTIYNSEWEWEQLFETQQDIFLHTPFAPTQGNHDAGGYNFTFRQHFNLNCPSFDSQANTGSIKFGSTYTFIYGDAQFFALNGELYDNTNYINDVKNWIRSEINSNPNIKWRIVYYHKTIYGGNDLHQKGTDSRDWRNAMAPFFDELNVNIDIAFQGHDHLYEVIGPVFNKDTVAGAVSNVQNVPVDTITNVNGKSGGIFNVKKGTLYFVNSASGPNPSTPNLFPNMPGYSVTGVPNYPSLFTGRFGSPKSPTYSHVEVSQHEIIITTYKVYKDASGVLHHDELDKIRVVKYCDDSTQRVVTYTQNQTFTNVNLVIGDTLRIKNGATVTFKNSTLRFYSSAMVIIEPGSKLVLDGTTLTNSCPGKLWYGIFVSGNTNLPQNARNQGTLELINGAIIENAKNAIATHDLKPNGDIDWDRRGGIIYANNATFKNNRRSMEFLAYENVSNGRVSPNLSYFKNCQFIVGDSNLFATSNTKFLNHFTMWGVSGVKIQGCKFENNITSMPARKSAIYTIDAGYVVDEYCGTAINPATCECLRPSAPSFFKGFDNAIESSNSTKQYAISIDRSNFAKNITGIKLSAKNSIQLSRLKIDMNNPYDNYPVGIYLDECNGYKIEGNDIYSNGNGYSTRATQGSSSCGADNLFTSPCVSNFYVGAQPPQVNYYRDPSVPGKEPVCKSGITVSNATSNLCKETLCGGLTQDTVGGGGNPNGKSSFSLLTEYRELKSKYSEMLNHFYAKGYDKILTDYYNGIIENEELLKEAMLYHEAILAVTESMALLSHDALFALKTDTIIDLHQIRDWYDEIYTLSAKYSLAETYYQLGNFAAGMRTLSLIPEMYKLNEDEMMEHQNYLSLYTFKNEIAESGRTIAQLTEDEIIRMQYFAEATSGLSSKIAQGILCFFYYICLDDVMRRGLDDEMMKVEEQKSRKAEGQKSRNAEGEKGDSYGLMVLRSYGLENITLIPNPTTGELTIDNGQLTINNVEVFDVYGRKVVAKFPSNVLEGWQPQADGVCINISNLPAGIYFIKIFTEKGEIVKKIVKQ